MCYNVLQIHNVNKYSTESNDNIITIYNVLLQDIRDFLRKEAETKINKTNTSVISISINVNNNQYIAVAHTGSDVSIISRKLFDTIKEQTNYKLIILPLDNLTILGRTGKKNKTIYATSRIK